MAWAAAKLGPDHSALRESAVPVDAQLALETLIGD
jgi:hypothetical protein